MGTKAEPGAFDCYAAAEDDEPMFVLLARDFSAPFLVQKWANDRVDILDTLSRGTPEYERLRSKIDEAYACAASMSTWRTQRFLRELAKRHADDTLSAADLLAWIDENRP